MNEYTIIKKYPTHEINRKGAVRRVNGRILVQTKTEKGYLRVVISGKALRVHRLVAETFIPNENNLPEINHLDGDKSNNSVENLEWSDHLSNMRHAFRTGLIPTPSFGENARRAILKDEDALFIKKYYKRGHKEFGAGVLASKYGVHISTICKITSGKNWITLTQG